MHEVTGNRAGLKPSELSALERVYRRRVDPREVVSAELGAFLCEISRRIGRQVGVLVSRQGAIEHVFVGDASRIVLPEVGRLRAGHGRFRGLRLVHTHLRNEALSRDDLVDLALLRLDLVAAVGVNHEGRPADLCIAYVRAQTWIHGVIAGARSTSQMALNLARFRRPPLSLNEIERINAVLPRMPAAVLTQRSSARAA